MQNQECYLVSKSVVRQQNDKYRNMLVFNGVTETVRDDITFDQRKTLVGCYCARPESMGGKERGWDRRLVEIALM
uniref:Uncharacterized protein n=1 Tax=Anopheles arabiensis TaxID=7173 RepID=A0A182HVL4_ANOAR